MLSYSASAVTKTGRRSNNQDNFMLGGNFAPVDHGTYSANLAGNGTAPLFAAVCDGMGGEASGERASFAACVELANSAMMLTDDFSANKNIIRRAVLAANDRLCEIMQREQQARMGSTVVSLLIQDSVLFYTNLGDSRLYILRGGRLIQLTKDHTEGQSMVDAGVLTPEQLKKHPSRNKLSRHLGIFPEEMRLECAAYEDIPLKAGDKLLIASDGVFGVLEDGVMTSILSEAVPTASKAEKLVDTAFGSGSKDNMTALVIEVTEEKTKTVDLFPYIMGGLAVLIILTVVFIVLATLRTRETSDPFGEPDVTAETVTETPEDTEGATAETLPAEETEEHPTPGTAENGEETDKPDGQPTDVINTQPSTEGADDSPEKSPDEDPRKTEGIIEPRPAQPGLPKP